MRFQPKITLPQRMMLRRLYREIPYGHKCRFYSEQAQNLEVSSSAVFRAVHGVSLNRYAKRRDTAEPAIIQALEQAGAEVWALDYPVDLLVRFRKQWHLLECKTIHKGRRKELRDKRQVAQQNFIATTGTPIVRDPLEALRAIGAIT